jgi:hypothetical protein
VTRWRSLSGVVVAVSNYGVRRADAEDAQQAELRAASVAFFTQVDVMLHGLRTEPTPGRFVAWVNAQVEHFPQLDYVTRRLHTRLLDPQFDTLPERTGSAANRLLLVAPLELLGPIGDLLRLLGRAGERDPAWDEQVEAVRGEALRACRRALGQPVGE